ncbi:hypothetical protein BCR37DRAFT_53487 [Protomyces lactucae-debilis]|uniref:Secreted protein n=1 Tax=Protomyces lactucae-debilis TaxID=2754530 RepID=A0A1Y2FA51_PROLT|nr:uncharacterized protein BCR37DRAFT_53487 [Protomyces lactucae-debilis]ORY80789.1 hypothetical protein BCR37DRAFT_53487 [Protomyces lactucae-debilis]
MYSASPGILTLTIMMVILLQLIEQTAGYQAPPCNENNIGKCYGTDIQSDGKSCKQLRNCKFFAKINNKSDPHDAHKTWINLRGQIGPNDKRYWEVWTPKHTYPHWKESAEDLFNPKYNYTELRITCWRAWKTEAFRKKNLVNGKYEAVVDCNWQDPETLRLQKQSEKHVYCCNQCKYY